MDDGRVNIDVGLNISKAERDLEKLKNKINKAEAQLNSDVARKSELEAQLEKAANAAEKARRRVQELREEYNNSRGSSRAEIRPRLDNALANYRDASRDAERLGREFWNVSESIETGTANLTDMREQAGAMEQELADARVGERLSNTLEAAKNKMEQAKNKMVSFVKYAVGIGSVYALFKKLRSGIADAVSAFAKGDETTRNSIEGIRAALEQLKLSWGAAFAPILNAVAPLIQRLIGWLTAAANAVARFIAILSGKSSYQRVISSTEGVSSGVGGIGSAAEDATDEVKELKKQLLGFDELNLLNDTNSSKSGSGGGGGGGGAGFATETVPVDAFDGSFLSNLAFSVRDVLFDWTDLNPEQIAQKAISGLSTILGAGVGFMIGGVPGAIVGALIGLTLSLVADAMIFDHDGVLDPNELADTLEIALNGLAGGAIGFVAGGPAGALIGATIGTGLTLLAKTILPTLGAGSTSNLIQDFVDGLGRGAAGGAGGVIGFTVGGPGGAAIGALIGLGLSFVIQKIRAYNPEENGQGNYTDKVSWFLCGVLGMPTNEQYKEYGNKAIEWFVEGFGDFIEEIHNVIGGPLENFIEVELPETMGFFKELGPKAIEWLTEGFSGFLDEIHNIIGGPLENLIEVEIPETIQWFRDLGPNVLAHIKENFPDFSFELDQLLLQPFRTLWDKLTEWWNTLSLAPFHVPRPVFEWGSRAADGALAKVLNFFGLEPSVPTLSISWMARGGILDGATLIGAGEAGKEAIIPLEQNTEWITLVADGLLDRIKKNNFANELADAFAMTPKPAMAGGYITPPNAVPRGYSGGGDSLLDEIRALRSEISALASQPIEVRSNLYMDKRKVGESVTEYQRTSARSSGR